MKRYFNANTRLFFLSVAASLSVMTGYCNDTKPRQEFYEIKVYHLKNVEQEKIVDDYLQHAFLPALHKTGIAKVGVFKPLTNDTAADKLIYVFIPLKSIDQLLSLPAQIGKDNDYNNAGTVYLNAVYTDPPYTRVESILLKAFRLAPQMQLPKLTGPKTDRIYELRSYESATEKLYLNKVQMFNEGGEIPLFDRLGFNAVFYADVVNGSHMPNLMYMTSFENKTIHDEKWKTFGSDPEWKKLSAMPEYQHNVSKADIVLMHAADYSDIQ
jgi:hypothetical protein